MGLTNRSNAARKTYVNVVGGKFAIKATADTEGAVSRVNKNNETVWELQYSDLSNVALKNIEKKVKEGFGASWEITFGEADEDFILNLPFSGRVTNGLMHRLPNIDVSREFSLLLHFFVAEKAGEKDKTFLTVNQGGQKIEPAYTKENPNGLPPMTKKKVKGVDTWDDSDQIEFIENMVNTVIKPKLENKAASPVVDESKSFVAEEPQDLDLPF